MPKFRRKTKEERCTEIQEAARRVFLTKGYRSTTMEDVIAETSLSKGGVYRYYSSTKDILIDIMKSGNKYRMSVFEEIRNRRSPKQPDKDVMISMVMNKLYAKHIDKKLYTMFLSEIIYQEDIKSEFYKLEQESEEEIKDILGPALSGKSKEDYKFMSRFISAFIFIDQLFEEENVMEQNKDKVRQILEIIL